MPVLAAVPILAGLLVATIGYLGLCERLPRNRFLGVRTPASLRDEEAFRLANRVAGLPTLVAGLTGILTGTAAAMLPNPAALAVLIIGLLGLIAITIAGGTLGHRAALALPERAPEPPASCGGCACGNCGLGVGPSPLPPQGGGGGDNTASVGSDVAGVGGE